MKIIKNILFLLLILAVALIVRTIMNAPNNEELISKFRANESKFNELRTMFLEDKNLYVIGTYNTGDTYIKYYNDNGTKLSEARIKKYFDLLHGISVDSSGRYIYGENESINGVFFNAARTGWAGGGHVWRWVWLSDKPNVLEIKKGSLTTTLYSIVDNWYVLVDYSP